MVYIDVMCITFFLLIQFIALYISLKQNNVIRKIDVIYYVHAKIFFIKIEM